MLEQNQGTIYIGNIAGENSNVDVLSKTMDAVDSGGIVGNNSGLSASIVACYAIKGQMNYREAEPSRYPSKRRLS